MHKFSFILLILFSLSTAANAETFFSFKNLDENQLLSETDFTEHIKEIIVNQPEFLKSISVRYEKNENKKYAKRLRFPEVNFAVVNNESLRRSIEETNSIRKRRDDSFDGVISVRQPIYQGNEINSRIKVADAELKSVSVELNKTTSELILTACQIYLDTAVSQLIYEYAKDRLNEVEKYRELAETRFRAGAAENSELALTNVRLSDMEANLAILEAEKIRHAREYVAFFKNIYDKKGLPKVQIITYNRDNSYSTSYEQELAKLNIENQEGNLGITRSKYRPQLGIQIQYTEYDLNKNIDDNDLRGGMYLNFPFINFGRGRAETNASKSKVKQAKVNYNIASRDTEFNRAASEGSVNGLISSRNKILESFENVKLQRETLNLRSEVYNFSGVPIIEIAKEEVTLYQRLMDTEKKLILEDFKNSHLERALLSRFRMVL